jgi:alpha-ribazole phosphatase/probable phosphoglycerate mutase
MGKLYIVRHGETEWNSQGRVQGHTDIPLSEAGRQQAQYTAERLKNVNFDIAYSSDLSRTSETAEIILGKRNIQVNTLTSLREYNKGVFEGLTVEEYSQRYPDQYDASLINDLDFAPESGESIRDVSERMSEFGTFVKSQHLNDDVLIVGHGGALRSLVADLLSLPIETAWKLVTGNCSLTIIHMYPDNSVLHLYNDTSHIMGRLLQ